MHSILVIDNNKEMLILVRLILAISGYHVETATNGEQGILKFDKGYFDLVIMDIGLKGNLEGKELVRCIHESESEYTPIIGISRTPWLLNDSDFDIVLKKPLPIKELIDSVVILTTHPFLVEGKEIPSYRSYLFN